MSTPLHPAAEEDSGTRARVRELVIELGPVQASSIAERLDLTPAAVRRHLTALVDAGEVCERAAVRAAPRGRGRPPREYVATGRAQQHLPDDSSLVARQALRALARSAGPAGVQEFAREWLREPEERYAAALAPVGESPQARATALADLLSRDGYAASVRTVSLVPERAAVVQLCQGHCPVREIAQEFPQLCEAETQMLQRLLGVHVQRLATIAGGGHACTTHIPGPPPEIRPQTQPRRPSPATPEPIQTNEEGLA
ncbi:helix-turn-helix transcriptional regulator [Serinibacter salmoneus]|uniref:helix-turn-helix transcriptional regulator n=1 Tax=Serinibacter salmoneus TaxID=556530 RepID=UPI001FE5A00E|nr:ArsR family transcriptional regulator [Serinibacter salmoneus]